MKNLQEVFTHTLEDVYYAEKALIKALPKVRDAAQTKALKQALDGHLEETRSQVKILEDVFASIGESARGVKCDAIEGLVKETEGLIEDSTSGQARDAALIAACQAVEHYEIARYGSLREWAKSLGYDDAHDLLGQILDMEKAANHKLTHLAISEVNDASAKTIKSKVKSKAGSSKS